MEETRKNSWHTDINGRYIYEGDSVKCIWECNETHENGGQPCLTVQSKGFTVDVVRFNNFDGWHVVNESKSIVPLSRFACVCEVVNGVEEGLHVTESIKTEGKVHSSYNNLALHPSYWKG